MEDKRENRCGFDGEFQSLKMLEDRLVFTTNEGMKAENVNKNRYRNILPCEYPYKLLLTYYSTYS